MDLSPTELKENRKKWVEALRSGEYTQCKNVLHDGTGYCCLGVLCVVAGMKPQAAHGNHTFDKSFLVAPEHAMEFVGLRTSSGEHTYAGQRNSLTTLNDDGGLSFEQIADIIESEPEGLFKP